jgi:hypothetical protein
LLPIFFYDGARGPIGLEQNMSAEGGDPSGSVTGDLISASAVAKVMAASLYRGDQEAAIRDLTEAVGRLIRFAGEGGGPVPGWVTSEPKATGLDPAWRTYLATAFAYGLQRAGQPVERWMSDAPALAAETAMGDDPSPEFRLWLRTQTPQVFLDKNLLSRAADWAIA